MNETAPSLSTLRPDVPGPVAKIVEKALVKDPAGRYQNVGHMLDDIKLARESIGKGAENRREAIRSVAVLPFTNMSSDEEQNYFCDGIAEDIINHLTHIEDLRVAARTSSFAVRDANLDIREIGKKLGVETILEGSVQKAGRKLRITAQLINAGDGYHVWSEQYDRDLEDVFAIQDEIGHNIVDALKIKLTDKEKRALDKVPTTDLEAYDFYVRGRQHFHGLGAKGLQYARNMFTSAIIRDTNYALAYCGLADCYAMIFQYHDSNESNVENAITASKRALEIDPELPEAHASLALAYSLIGRYEEAEVEFERAIELSPKLFEAYYYYARMCRMQGNPGKSVELFAKACDARPEDYQAPILMADTFRGLDRPDEKLEAFKRGLAVAEKHLEFHPEDARAWYLGAHALLELGNNAKALVWTERAMRLNPEDAGTLYNAACLFAIMGELDRCFDCFEKAVENGFANREWVKNDPDLAAIRSDPRYKGLLAKLR